MTELPAGGLGGGRIKGGLITGGVGGVFLGTTGPPLPQPPPVTTAVPNRPPAPNAVTVGSDGRFSFKDLNAATYRIMVVANGYARGEYGQRVSNGQGTPIYLAAGE